MKIDGVDILGGPNFPADPASSNLFHITDNSGGNEPGLYTRIGGTWARVLVDGDDIELDGDLDSIADLAGLTGILRKTGANTWVLDTKTYLEQNQPVSIKAVAFTPTPNTTGVSGSVSIDWSQSNQYNQAEPTGAITYSFTPPAGPCHLQLYVNSDGTSAAQTFTWPASVIWFGATWTAVANKRAIINFWYDGTNYLAMGANQV
jgi:hypothetical protein